MTGDTMKPFNTGIPGPSDSNATIMLNPGYHMDHTVTWDRLSTRDGTYFQLIKQDAACVIHPVN